MSIRSGQTVSWLYNFGTSDGPANYDAIGTATLYINGTANGAAVVHTNPLTGQYKIAFTLPTLALFDTAQVIVSGLAVNGVGVPDRCVWFDTQDGLSNVSGGGGVAGPGADTVTLNFTKEASAPVEGASIWISTDSAGVDVVAGPLTTDSAGDVDFLLDDGDDYYAFARLDGLNPILGQAFTADSSSGNDFSMTTATTPAGNYYCNPAAFAIYYDIRQMGMLSRDDNERAIFTATVQALLDAAADELNSHLAGRYAIPLATGGVTWDIATATMPGPLTKWVAVKTCERLYARRNDRPKTMDKDVEDVDGWLDRIISGESSLADKNGVQLGRGLIATLDSSDFTDGRSRFDGGLFPRASATSPSRGL